MNLFEKTQRPFTMVAMNKLMPSVIYQEDDPYNPDIKWLKTDIAANGLNYPLEVEEKTMRITKGNERFLALKNLNVLEVPVVFITVTDRWDRPKD